MIDLHCHTKVSDCSYTNEEVIAMAKQRGVTNLAITNHDTTDGLKDAIRIGKQAGVNIIPGIEISAFDTKRGRRAHLLGLYITPGHPSIKELCQPLVEKRHLVSKMMVERIIAAGYDITWEQVKALAEGGTGVYKQHIMHALLEKGYTKTIYGALYKELFRRGSDTEGAGIAFIPIDYIPAEEAIRAIQEAEGIPILAHPGQFDNFEAAEEWVGIGLKGIEVKHPLHDANHRAKAIDLAQRFDLIQTGGSDFHGFYSDTDSTIGSYTTDPIQFDRLMEHKSNVLF
ncbi:MULTISPECIES: PHP domain-containing protein [Bacillus]|uniref:Phosphoesterase n=2 Tax=Bacillus TaxID=1386 RepID=A0A0M3RAW1_9BACI|nr:MULTISPECIES: PHP domain-containing protein [Bacillus]ALC83852.1 phosphoesterase [Bacillus gobiensis]MBP1083111.1 putative metal-dependent phosphoesterase TrpH [Bacillus capparidis]MED1097938.1 PHP domain-containing protein [Bacillus capparidis]